MKKAFSVFTGGNTNSNPTNSSASSRISSSFGSLFSSTSSTSTTNNTLSGSIPSTINNNNNDTNDTKSSFSSLSSTAITSPTSFTKTSSLSTSLKNKLTNTPSSTSSKYPPSLAITNSNFTSSNHHPKNLDILLHEFNTYSNQLQILYDAVQHIYSCMDNLCTSFLTVAESITPLASSYANMKSEASEYLNATTLLTNILLPIIHKALNHLLLQPLQSILASHNELKNRIDDRNKAQIEYDIACVELQKLQKKIGSTSSSSNRKKNNYYENNGYQPNDPKSLAAQAKVVSKLTSSQALVTALSDALTDELKTLSTRRKEVVTRLFIGITSILQNFTFGSAASFMDCDFSVILQSLQTLSEENNDMNTISIPTNINKSTDTVAVQPTIATNPPVPPTTTDTTTEDNNSTNRASSPIAMALAALSSVVNPLTSSNYTRT